MYNKTTVIVKETGLPFLLINEAKQLGNNFAEKFCNAIEYCFTLGYKNIITIGSDCSTLSAPDILQAYNHLQNNYNTIGADSHGGFYLLALQKDFYQRSSFLNFNWCSRQLFADITGYLNTGNKTAICTLQNKADINTAANLKKVINFSSTEVFIRLLSRLSNCFNEYCNSIYILYHSAFYSSFALRGPPVFTKF